ncbi:MAG: NAD(P)/FAD-dependent oxidoreductase [Cytophagales bacterium]|nr:NAD(P)/FAD-dependent oxidoreductase [Cytophagales bacterium]
MIQSYKQKHDTEGHFDVIFIGSGMGCQAAAAVLAKEGKRVLVLERHYTAGGYTHVFKRRGYEWDVGIHYIGEVNRENSVLRKLFDYITDGELKWADMGEVYDRIVVGDKIYDFRKGVNNFKDQLKAYFPKEADAIDRYVDLLFQMSKLSRDFYTEKALPKLMQQVMGKRYRKNYLQFATRTTLSVLQELTQDEELIKVLTGQYGDYGLPPGQSSFVMHAAVAKHYLQGGAFPVGGSSQIVENVAPVIAQSGGKVLTNAEVAELVIENNSATGVKLADGTVFTADQVVSGTGIFNTYGKLIPKPVAEKHGFSGLMKTVKPSAAHVCLYLGLNGTAEELNLPKANYWLYPEDLDHDAAVERYARNINAPFPVVYISFPSAKDPTWLKRYPGKSTIDIITVMPYELFEQWEETRWKKRGEEYEAQKEALAQRLLEALYKREPQVKGKIDHYELSTPVTTRHFMNYEKGELYGLDHDPSRYEQRFLQPRTSIKNFFLTGQDVVTAGVGGALFAGYLTASAMTGKNYVKKAMMSS